MHTELELQELEKTSAGARASDDAQPWFVEREQVERQRQDAIDDAASRPPYSTAPARLRRGGWPLLVAADHLDVLVERLDRGEVLAPSPHADRVEVLADRAARGELPRSTRPRRVVDDGYGLFTATNGRDYVTHPDRVRDRP